MKLFRDYYKVKSIEEAYELNQKRSNYIVGGMLWLKMESGNAGTAIDISDLGLNKIEEDAEQFTIGAMVTLRQLEKHEGLNSFTQHAVCDAVKDIVGVQFRNLATVGGSIWKRAGFSDVLTVFMGLDSYVELYKGGIVPMQEFAKMSYDNDILMHIIVKKTPTKIVYTSMRNTRTDFPTLALAASSVNGSLRITVGGRPGRASSIEINNASSLSKSEIAAVQAVSSLAFGDNLRGSAEYRKHLTRVLTERALDDLAGICKEGEN